MKLQIFVKIDRINWLTALPAKKYSLLLYLIVLSGLVFAQTGSDTMDKCAYRLDSLAKNHPTELIYLQTSKNIYETGEDLWFKAYVLNAQYLVPSQHSQTLYLQLLNEKNLNPVWQEKYEVKNGFANGHVFINDTLSEGTYFLMAYTGQSFFQNEKEFKAFREIEIRKDLKPHVTVAAQFKEASFTKDDSVAVTISALTEQQKPQYAQLTATLLKDGQELEKIQTTTSQIDGTANICFNPAYSSTGLSVKIEAKHSKGTENIVLPVPFHKGSPIQFGLYPEGGKLVSSLQSRVAFKAVNRKGLPEEVQGVLFENNDTLLKISSTHNGMGSFSFIPFANKNYKVKLTSPKTDSVFSMPKIQPQGISLQMAKRDSSFLWFKVQQSKGMPQIKIFLRGQSRGVVYCMASAILRNELDIKIPLSQFPLQGIAEFTLFSNQLQPLAERLVYVNPENKLNIDVQLDKKKYSTREKVNLKLKVTDHTGQPIVANLGATVYDKIYRNKSVTQNILTHCHLFTQLKGNIYNPAYYFNKENKDRYKSLDLLLLTQGWRRYVWSETALKEQENKKQTVIEDGINGRLYATKKRKKAPIEGQFVMVHNPGENLGMDLLGAAYDGSFAVLPAHLKNWQGGYVYLKPMGNEDFGYKLKLSNPFDSINHVVGQTKLFYPQYKPPKEEPPKVRAFVSGPNVIELDEVTIKGKTKVQFRDKYLGQLDSLTKLDLSIGWVCSHPAGYSNAGYLNDYRQGYCHCDDTSRTKPIDGKTYRIVKYEQSTNGKRYVVDVYEMRYSSPQFTEAELLKMHNLSRVKAYYNEREFYQPNYDKKEEQNSMIPDYRNTLLWEPMLLTDKNGEATLEFCCSDIYTGFTGIIEGLDGSGQLGCKEFEFNVRKTKRFEWEK